MEPSRAVRPQAEHSMPRIQRASWFETRGVATLLTMRVKDRVKTLSEERACARLEG